MITVAMTTSTKLTMKAVTGAPSTSPRRIATTNDYVGVYFSNTTELTKERR